MKVFNLPDLGEGLPDAEIVQWHVKEGDHVDVDQLLVSMETAKAVVEVPSPFSGTISKLHGVKGEIIPTHAPLVSFEGAELRQDTGTVVGKVEVGNEVVSEMAMEISRAGGGVKVLPAVRALAKKLNIDLMSIVPTGTNGMITKEDVEHAHARFSEAGPLDLLHGARRAMAMTMQQSHAEVVPVSIYDDADISDWKDKDYTVRLLKAIAFAAQQEPALNAWYDAKAMGRRLLEGCHIAIAVDTEEGLFVPVIKDVQTKNADALRQEIDLLKSEVKNRTIKPEKMRGNTFTLSNFGTFAGRYASPIVVPPTVGILAVGKVRDEVRPIKGDPQIRKILPLSLSFDHRAVTGGEASRFLGFVIQSLQEI